MRRAVLIVLAALALAGCAGSDETPPAARPGTAEPTQALDDLGSVLDLRAAFNDDQGAPRLILLLSPT